MPIFGSKPEPSLSDRLLSATLAGEDARVGFILAAKELEDAADDLDILAQDTQNELDRLVGIFEAAIADSDANRAAAANLRAIVSGPQLALL